MSTSIRPPRLRDAIGRELRGVGDVLSLSWPRAFRAVRGDGHSVIVLPGYLTSDVSTKLLRDYLGWLGYDARGWNLGRNRGQMRHLVTSIMRQVEDLHDSTGAKPSLVGWSLGGVVAREAARELPDLVRGVITLGTPVQGGPKYTIFARPQRKRGTDLDAAAALVERRHLDNPLRVPVTSIYSKRDGIVAWGSCLDPWSDGVEVVEVKSSHLAMGAHPAVFRAVADRLGRRYDPAPTTP